MARVVPLANQENLAADDEFDAHPWVPAIQRNWLDESEEEVPQQVPEVHDNQENVLNRQESSESEDQPPVYENRAIRRREFGREERSQEENELMNIRIPHFAGNAYERMVQLAEQEERYNRLTINDLIVLLRRQMERELEAVREGV